MKFEPSVLVTYSLFSKYHKKREYIAPSSFTLEITVFVLSSRTVQKSRVKDKSICNPYLVVEVNGPIVPAEPDLVPPGHVANGHQYLSLTVWPDVHVVLVPGDPGLHEVHAGHVRLAVAVHDEDVIVSPILGVWTEAVSKATSLVLAQEAVLPADLPVGRVQVELEDVRLHWSSRRRAVGRNKSWNLTLE